MTSTPRGPYALDRPFDSARIPAFDAQYGSSSTYGWTASSDASSTTRPQPASSMPGRKARTTRAAASRFVSTVSRQPSSSMSRKSPVAPVTPAAWTSRSGGPNVVRACAPSASTSARRVTSAARWVSRRTASSGSVLSTARWGDGENVSLGEGDVTVGEGDVTVGG